MENSYNTKNKILNMLYILLEKWINMKNKIYKEKTEMTYNQNKYYNLLQEKNKFYQKLNMSQNMSSKINLNNSNGGYIPYFLLQIRKKKLVSNNLIDQLISKIPELVNKYKKEKNELNDLEIFNIKIKNKINELKKENDFFKSQTNIIKSEKKQYKSQQQPEEELKKQRETTQQEVLRKQWEAQQEELRIHCRQGKKKDTE